jgi:hypothetical protein
MVSRSTALPRLQAARFVLPLREGGSMPALVDGDDGGLWVLKLRGAAQGTRVLVAEVICGELARALELPMPPLAVVALDAALARTESDAEVRDLLLASAGDNLGMAFLPGAVGFDPAAATPLPAGLAARVVAFDVLVSNVDRTVRNPNLLWSGGTLWLIDHGAALYWHHAPTWNNDPKAIRAPLPRASEHVLLPFADRLGDAGAALAARATDDHLAAALAAVPDEWLTVSWPGEDPATRRAMYVERLRLRRDSLAELCQEVERGAA